MQRVKRFSMGWQSLRPLFWVGPVALFAGISARFVSGKWDPVSVGLLILGALICGTWLALQGPGKAGFWKQRSTQTGSNAVIATVSVCAILLLLNFLAVRYSGRVDLTQNQLFTLAPQTQQVVKGLKEPVKLVVFSPQLRPRDQDLLQNYRRQAPEKFRYELVDPQAQPGLAEAFGVNNLGDVFLEVGQRRQFVQALAQGDRLSESKLTNALAQLRSTQRTQVYILQGHGERPLEPGQGSLSQAMKELEAKNIFVKPLTLAQTKEIPADATSIVIAGPKRALFDAEVLALQTYLQQGGSLLMMIDPLTEPGLTQLLQEWGVKLSNTLVIDPNSRVPTAAIVTNYGQSPITQDFGQGFSFFPGARPLDITSAKDVTSTPLLLSSQQSWAETNLQNQNLQFNPDQGDRQGPLTLGVALSRTIQTAPASKSPSPTPTPAASPKPDPKEARMVVIGNSTFATDGLFEQQLNGDVFLNTMVWLSQNDDQLLSIRPKESTNRRLTLTQEQSRTILLMAVFFPLIAFSTAGLVWWRRR
jgi:ABC-type uncharacterized transport system involved in gliding motility auxiliary subunit